MLRASNLAILVASVSLTSDVTSDGKLTRYGEATNMVRMNEMIHIVKGDNKREQGASSVYAPAILVTEAATHSNETPAAAQSNASPEKDINGVFWDIALKKPEPAPFMWLRRQDDSAVITFGELAGTAGPSFLLSLVADKTRLFVRAAGGNRTELDLFTRSVGKADAELVASIPAELKAPYLMEAMCVYGSFGPNRDELLKYYSNADSVTTQNDWFGIQDTAESELDITLRDPWMSSPAAAASTEPSTEPFPPGYQCPQGSSTYLGDACVIVVVRFQGSLIESACNVSIFSSNGSKLRASLLPASALGVGLVRVPMVPDGVVFASVSYRHAANGTIDNHTYSVVDHWATTSFVLQRSNATAAQEVYV